MTEPDTDAPNDDLLRRTLESCPAAGASSPRRRARAFVDSLPIVPDGGLSRSTLVDALAALLGSIAVVDRLRGAPDGPGADADTAPDAPEGTLALLGPAPRSSHDVAADLVARVPADAEGNPLADSMVEALADVLDEIRAEDLPAADFDAAAAAESAEIEAEADAIALDQTHAPDAELHGAWLAGQMAESLDRLLPLVRAYLQVEHAHGGPDPERLIDDPDGAQGERTLPEVVQAETLLFQAPMGGEDAFSETSGLDQLPDCAFVEDADERPEVDDAGDPLFAAARRFADAETKLRALRIAGLEPTHALVDEAAAARDALTGRLPGPHDPARTDTDPQDA